MDLLVRGVWLPVMNYLADKFPNMFSVGIADTLHRVYAAVELFTARTSVLLRSEKRDVNLDIDEINRSGELREDPSPTEREGESEVCAVAGRMRTHSALHEFHSKWKLDIYYQVAIS